MPIVVKKKKGDSNRNIIGAFKKATKSKQVDVVEEARERRYYRKPSEIRAEKLASIRHRKKRLKTLKNMKNASIEQIRRLQQG
jgi:ribosomal protein S21